MSNVDRQVSHTRRRLTMNVFVHRLSLGLLIAAGLWGLTIVVVRLFALGLPLWHGAWVAALVAVAVGLVATMLARPSPLHAAVELDAAAGLKERLSTALAVRGQGDPFVRAAVGDAERTAGRVHVPSHIRYRAPELWPWSVATVLAALLLAGFMPTFDLFADEAAAQNLVPRAVVEAEQQAIKQEFEQRLSRIKELSKDNPGLQDLVEDLKPLEMPDEPTITPEDIRREAVKRIDDVQDKLRRELEARDEDLLKQMQRMLNQLDPEPGDDPGSKLSQALASGNIDGAKRSLQELMQELNDAAKSTDDPQQRAKLERMAEQLARLSEQLAKMSETVQLQKELENRAGLSEEEAQKLLEQLAKMDPKQLEKELQKSLGGKGLSQKQIEELAKKIRQSQKAQKACKSLSQALSQAAKACQQCSGPGGSGAGAGQATNALSNAMGQLSDLEMSEQLLSELEAQLADLQDLREGVCQGGLCPGGEYDPTRVGPQGPRAGLGYGSRIGDQRTPYDRKPTKLKSRYQGGAIIGQMLIEGPQVRGQATADELTAVESEVRDALDAVERDEVPRQYQKVLREYFSRLAGLMDDRRTDSEESPPTPKP